MLLIKRCLLAFFIVNFTQCIPLVAGLHHVELIPKQYLEAFIKLNPKILQVASQRTQGRQKEVIQLAIQQRQAGEKISDEALQIIRELIGPFDTSHFNSPVAISDEVLKKLKFVKSVQYNQEEVVYHELLYKPMKHPSAPPTSTHHLSIKLDHMQSTLQEEINKTVKKQYKEECKEIHIPLRDLIMERQKVPSVWVNALTKKLRAFIKSEKAYKVYKNNNQYENYELPEGERLRKTYKDSYREVKRAAKALNISKEYFYLFKTRDEVDIRTNPKTRKQDVQIAVDLISRSYMSIYGNDLIVGIEHPQRDASDAEDEGQVHRKLDANEEISIENYALHQKTQYHLTSYLQEEKDDDTGASIFYVFYQVYDPEQDDFIYYLYSPEGTEEITEEEFFEETYSDEVAILFYQKMSISQLKPAVAWMPQEVLKDIKNALLGASLVFALWSYMSIDKQNRSIRWQPPPLPRSPDTQPQPNTQLQTSIKGSGMPNNTGNRNLRNICFLISAFQALRAFDPDILTKTINEIVNRKAQAIIEALERGEQNNNQGEGVTEQQVLDWREALNELKGFTGLFKNTFNSGIGKHEDASEFIVKWIEKYVQPSVREKYKSLIPHDIREFRRHIGITYTKALDDEKKKQLEEAFKKTVILPERKASEWLTTLPLKGLGTENFTESATMKKLLEYHEAPENEKETTLSEHQMETIYSSVNQIMKTSLSKRAKKINGEALSDNEKEDTEWEKALKDIKTYVLGKKEDKLSKDFDASSRVINGMLTSKFSGTALANNPRDLYDKILQPQTKEFGTHRMQREKSPEKLTEFLYQENQTKAAGLCRVIEDFYNGLSKEQYNLLDKWQKNKNANEVETLIKGIYDNLKTIGFDAGSLDSFKANIAKNEPIIDVNPYGEVIFRYKFTRSVKYSLKPGTEKIIIITNRNVNNKGDSGAQIARQKTTAKIEKPFEVAFPVGLDAPKPNAEKTKFQLKAFIVQSGSADFGHYYTYVKKGEKWFLYDDAGVYECTQQQAYEGHKGRFGAKDAYVFLYEKVPSG